MSEFVKNPNPTKDQHFMVDKRMIEKICNKAEIKDGEEICEIGGGSGALTEVLASYGNPVTVIELDHYYAELLKDKFSGYSNVMVIEGNALDFSYNQYDKIVANLPYTITEPFLENLARTGALFYDKKDKKSSNIKSITLVVSQNSARKMVAPIQCTEGNSRHFNSEFGMISAICKAYLNVNIDCAIPSNAFFPEPAVTSFLVNLTFKKKKTTVDRIMQQILMDRTDKNPTIGKIYNTMLLQGKIYNINKHKGEIQNSSKFTTKTIINSNVYDLTNAQISQLIKDLINNDFKMKSQNKRKLQEEDQLEKYLRTGFYDEFDEDEIVVKTKWQKKSEETYSYLYDESRYNFLLHRGLEFLDSEVLKSNLSE